VTIVAWSSFMTRLWLFFHAAILHSSLQFDN